MSTTTTKIFLGIFLLGCLNFEYVAAIAIDRNITSQKASSSTKRIDINIPPQNVSNNQEITWDKPRGLNGIYDVELYIFRNTQPDAGAVTLSVGEGDTMKNCTSSNVRDRDDKELSCFWIHSCQINISNVQEIKLLYNGNTNVTIRNRPKSHINFVNVSQVDCGRINNVSQVDCGRINNVSQVDCGRINNISQVDCGRINTVSQADSGIIINVRISLILSFLVVFLF